MVEILGYEVDLFWIGVLGALAVEVVTFFKYYEKNNHPEKYKKVGFYATALFLALLGGVMVSIHEIKTAPAALQIGASASAVLLALAKSTKPKES